MLGTRQITLRFSQHCKKYVGQSLGRNTSPSATSTWCRTLNTSSQDSTAQVEAVADESEIESSVKPRRPPFAKSLFLGSFDVAQLAFPEVLDKEQYETLTDMIDPIERFFTDQVDSAKIDRDAKIPEETLQGLKDLGLFGQQIPPEYNGLGLGATEYARIAEITALDGSIAVTLAAHQAIGLKGILIAGNEEQKAKYLPPLATGEHVAAFCLTEPSSGSDAASIQTRATLADDGKTWLLSGGKIWISNGGMADVMTVFAKTEVVDHIGNKKDKVTAFIVERAFGGVTSGKPEDKLGIRGSQTCEVHFDNTPVPMENVLGEVGGGFKVAMNILNSGRFSMGSSGAGILKKLMGWSIEHALTRKQFGQTLTEFGMIQEKFAQMAVHIYAMESMAYLTAGILDGQEEPDCAVEAAIVKVFSSEGCWRWGSECLQVLGGLGYMKEYPYERYLRDGRILLIFEGTNEILRMFIALTGLQYAGEGLKEMVKKLRNPLMNPGFILGKGWERYRQSKGNPRLDKQLAGHLHPTLDIEANKLEHCVKRFQYAVEIVLARHGVNVVKEQMELRRIADIVIDLYAMTAVLSRASRSHCIGLRNSDHEILLASSFVQEASDRVTNNVKELEKGSFLTQDHAYKKIASQLFDNNGYLAEHPLTRNYW